MNAVSIPHHEFLFCNDQHSKLNVTRMLGKIRPRSASEIAAALRTVRDAGQSIAIAGGCHAMGGQQFASDSWLLDMRGMNRVLAFDREKGLLTAEAGITWPELMRHYVIAQNGASQLWGIRQKQTGADRLTLGGAVAANIHGRGLTMAPFVSDIESLDVVLPSGEQTRCSRNFNPELFRHVVGGYGLFGVVSAVTLRLARRQKVQRVVELGRIDSLMEGFESRIKSGYLYGDFQFSTAPNDPGFLERGVFSCYRPVPEETPIPNKQVRLSPDDWRRLLMLAHTDKRRAFDEFAEFYLRSTGQIYWSDTHQLSLYLDDYHGELDCALHADVPGSEMITELYVPRHRLDDFMADVRADFRCHNVNLIYGTIRLIEPDVETALPWAKDRYACVIFNLHVDHRQSDIERSKQDFLRLIDIAVDHGGSYFLTYHRYAPPNLVRRCYPQFDSFLQAKRRFDLLETLQSDWYRHYRDAFACGV